MRSPLLSILVLLLPTVLFAQRTVPEARTVERIATSSATVTDTPSTVVGSIHIDADPRIEKLMTSYSEHKHVQRGYRVQIFLGDRNKAEEIRRSFLVKHPDTPAYLDYLAPNFRVRVGDQRTKLEGEKLKQALMNEFPGLYVVPCEIEMPRLPEGN